MTDSVLITGASTGLGLETAVYLAERGFKVYATMRDPGRRQALDAEAARRGVTIDVLRLDVTDRASIEEAVKTVVEQSGGIYAVVNNAGIEMRGFFEDLSEQELRQPFETNLFGTMAVTRAVIPHMRAAGRGRIVITSSVGGRIGSLSLTSYCASRFGQEGFAESLYQELKPLGIHVSLVEPGITKTDHFASANHMVADKANSPESLYYPWFQQIQKITLRLADSSPTRPRHVAAAIHKALTARRPSLRYMVGRRAKLVVALRRYLPASIFERFYFGTIIRWVTRPSDSDREAIGIGPVGQARDKRE